MLASMKVPALRRGNCWNLQFTRHNNDGLNESPRPKAGKYGRYAPPYLWW